MEETLAVITITAATILHRNGGMKIQKNNRSIKLAMKPQIGQINMGMLVTGMQKRSKDAGFMDIQAPPKIAVIASQAQREGPVQTLFAA